MGAGGALGAAGAWGPRGIWIPQGGRAWGCEGGRRGAMEGKGPRGPQGQGRCRGAWVRKGHRARAGRGGARPGGAKGQELLQCLLVPGPAKFWQEDLGGQCLGLRLHLEVMRHQVQHHLLQVGHPKLPDP